MTPPGRHQLSPRDPATSAAAPVSPASSGQQPGNGLPKVFGAFRPPGRDDPAINLHGGAGVHRPGRVEPRLLVGPDRGSPTLEHRGCLDHRCELYCPEHLALIQGSKRALTIRSFRRCSPRRHLLPVHPQPVCPRTRPEAPAHMYLPLVQSISTTYSRIQVHYAELPAPRGQDCRLVPPPVGVPIR